MKELDIHVMSVALNLQPQVIEKGISKQSTNIYLKSLKQIQHEVFAINQYISLANPGL